MRASGMLGLVAALAAAQPLQAQPANPPPHQVVSSHIGLMNELQKRGPYAYVQGPYASGEYVVVGPLPPSPRPRAHNRGPRHYR